MRLCTCLAAAQGHTELAQVAIQGQQSKQTHKYTCTRMHTNDTQAGSTCTHMRDATHTRTNAHAAMWCRWHLLLELAVQRVMSPALRVGCEQRGGVTKRPVHAQGQILGGGGH